MANVDSIPAPAADAVVFRLHRTRVFLGILSILAPVALLLPASLLAARAMLGHPPQLSDLVQSAISAVVIMLAGATGAVVGMGNNLGWVRTSAAGLEFAATRHAPVFLPWSAVQAVRLRSRGPLAELVVTPTSLDAARVAPSHRRGARLRRRSDTPTFLIDVGLMTPGPPVLLTELHRRLAAQG